MTDRLTPEREQAIRNHALRRLELVGELLSELDATRKERDEARAELAARDNLVNTYRDRLDHLIRVGTRLGDANQQSGAWEDALAAWREAVRNTP